MVISRVCARGQLAPAAGTVPAPVTPSRNSPPVRRKTPMLSSPPSTITTPAAQRTRGPKRRLEELGQGRDTRRRAAA